MGEKRPNSNASNGRTQKKKFKINSGFLDPGTSGIYATCSRRKERLAAQELGQLFEEKFQEMYKEELTKDDDSDEENIDELSIEDQIKQELSELHEKNKPTSKSHDNNKKKEPLQFIDLDCECVIFCKTRSPIVPEEFVAKIIEDLASPDNMEKRTRYIAKLAYTNNLFM